MTRSVHDRTAPSEESSHAWAAFCDYRALRPGQRSLHRLLERYRHRSATDPPPPTKRLDTLKEWSPNFAWSARIAVIEAEEEQALKEAMARQRAQQAAQDAKLLHGVGSGTLAVAAVLLNQLVDSRTGQRKQPLGTRDLGVLARVGIGCLAAACGDSPEAGDPNAPLHRLMEHAPDDTRRMVVQGLRALAERREQHEGRR